MQKLSLNVQNVSKRFGRKHVFNDISFSFISGVLGIAGSNGSGKSTLMQCLAGLKRPSSGTVTWQKNDTEIDTHELRKHLGYAAPYINLYDELSCADNLHFLRKLRGINQKNESVQKALQFTGIASEFSQSFGSLSTGQQQRLRLAAALMHHPDILFLDEPGSNLDEAGRNLIKKLVTDFRNNDKLVLIASNIPAELDLCDRVYSIETEGFV